MDNMNGYFGSVNQTINVKSLHREKKILGDAQFITNNIRISIKITTF